MLRSGASVRVRTTLGASCIVAAALVVGAGGLVTLLRSTMIANIDSALELRAADIAVLVSSGTVPPDLNIEGEQDAFAQIIGPGGTVLASSRNIEGEPRITDAPAGSFAQITDSPIDAGAFRVYVRQAGAGDRLTVIVGRSLEDVETTARTVTDRLLLGVPVLVLLVGVVTWNVVGRALRPVERIRAEVADIGGTDLHRRVPEPGTADEIGQLAVTMNEMLDRLERASERQRQFVSDASHELRTPIATIRHLLDVARVHPPASVSELIGEISEENARMQHLVDDLLLLAREEQTQREARRALRQHALVDLDELALVEAHRSRPTEVTIDSNHLAPARVFGDEHQLARVIANLVDNAVRHAHHAVAIRTGTVGDQVTLVVDDDGPGVAAPDRERIFERFARADDDRSRGGGGAGLGLAIARDLVQNHHGTISVAESPELGGARFIVTLPRAVEAD